MNRDWTQHSDLGLAIKTVIDDYIAGHRTRSVATLSRTAGVSYSTLRRMAQKEGVPTAEPVLKIIDVALDGKDRADFLAQFFPEISRTVGLVGAETAAHGQPNAVLKPFYARDPHCLILLLAQNEGGTTVRTIERLYGEPGIFALREMVDSELLLADFDTGRIEMVAGVSVNLDADIILDAVRASFAHFDRGLLGTEAARASLLSGKVSLDALSRIKKIMTDALIEIVAIKENKRNAGPIPFFLSTLMNVFDRSAFLQEKQPTSGDHHEVH